MSRPSIMKRTVGEGQVLLSAAGGGVAEAIAVGALCVAIGLDHPLDLELFRKEEEAGEECFHMVWVNGDNHRSLLLG